MTLDLSRLERYRDLIDDWSAFVDAVQAPLPTTLWANTLRTSRESLADSLDAEGLATQSLAWYQHGLRAAFGTRPGKSLAYITGRCHIQEEVSMQPIALLDPQPGERVLDLCAAPGNKSVQAAIHMGGRGTVLANDVNSRRLLMISRNVERLGLTNVALSRWDASSLPPSIGVFDRVLADVPCSCEGTSRKNPEILWRKHQEPGRLAGAQSAILRKAVKLCKPGGRIVYSTCTYAPEENELVVNAVLREEDVNLVPASLEGFDFAPGITRWQGEVLLPELRHCLRAYPHMNDTGGFFVAVLEKSAA